MGPRPRRDHRCAQRIPALATIETAQPTPGPVVLAALVHALGYPPNYTSPATPGSHWDAVCTAPPPLTNSEISTVATVIDQLGPSNFEV